MAITHFIETSVPEIARARMKSQTQRVPEAFPVLVFGDTRNHNWVFMNQGTVEAFSGDPTYTLRVTIGEIDAPPTNGSYKLTCGANTTGSLDALSDAVTVEAALNALAQIGTDGWVKVTGTFPNFLITWVNVGVVTGLSGNASLLIPQSAITLTTLFTGSASVANQVSLQIRQAAITSQSTWTTIVSPAAGWTGQLTTNTSGALTLLANMGVAVGEFIEVSTVLTAEVLDPNGFPSSFYQTPITLRAKNLDPSNTVSNSIAYYNLGDLVYGNPAGTLSTLPGNNTTQRKFLTQAGDGTNSAKPNWNFITAADLPNSELPGAPNAAVQINIGGTFTGYSEFTYDPVNKVVAALRYTGTWTNGINASNVNTGTLPAAQLPYPNATTLGGTNSAAVATNKWIDSLGTNGVFRQTQPAVSNISGISGSLLNFLGTPTSSNLAAAVSDETGSGNLVFATSPNLVTPNIGAANGSALTINALTSTAILLGGGINPITASGLTYVTPTLTVPDAFIISSAGSIGLTASGASKNIILLATAGQVIIPGSSILPTPQSTFAYQFGALGTIEGIATAPQIQFRRTNTSAASPSNILSGDALFSLTAKGYMATGYSIGVGGIGVQSTQDWTDGANGTNFSISTTANGATSSLNRVVIGNYGNITHTLSSGSLAAWGLTGAINSHGAVTITDTSSSTGTVASAVFTSFGAPTINATNASVVYTDLANAYFAAPLATGNASATNAWGIWNAGKTRLDGLTNITVGNTQALVLVNNSGGSNNTVTLENLSTAGIAGFGLLNSSASAQGTMGYYGSTYTDANYQNSIGIMASGGTNKVVLGAGGVAGFTLSAPNAASFTPSVRSSAALSYFTINTPADTGQTASTESIGIKTVTATRTWATTGTVALQREIFFAGPTYASASPSQTFTDAFTLYATPPVQGTNAIFTRGHTFGIVDSTSATSPITGGFIVATTVGTTATSVGIGGGNINAGGTGTFGGTLSVTGHTTFEGVTSTGATGTGKLVYDGTPTLVTPVLGAATGTSLVLTGAYTSGNPNGGTAAAWKLGTIVTGVTATFVTTSYLQVDVAGTLYKIGLITSVP